LLWVSDIRHLKIKPVMSNRNHPSMTAWHSSLEGLIQWIASQKRRTVNADPHRDTPPPLISVIVPAHNEEEAIVGVIEDLQNYLPGCEIIVVDDCSTDRTGERASAIAGVRMLRLPYNCGYGAALRAGIQVANGDLIAWFDADGEHRAEDLATMIQRMREERLGVVLGARAASVSGSRFIGKLLIRMFAVLLGLGYVRDFNCGLRVFRRDVMHRFVLLLPTGYSASTTSTFLTIRLSIPFAFQQIVLRPRMGVSKVRMADGFRTFVTVLRIASLLHPFRLFGTLAALLGAVGAIYSLIVVLVNGQGLPTLGALMLIGALLIGAIAILADQLSMLRLQHSYAFGYSQRRDGAP
jgi:glycosyltransferase involved in cell wall biosynthesis